MRFFFGFLFGAFISVSALSQIPKQTPVPDDSIKVSTNLIQIDVSATDKDGRAVTDLRAEEFEVYENGKRQDLTNFTFVSTVKTVNESKPSVKPSKNSIPIPPVRLRQEDVRRTYALVVDDLGLNFASVNAVQKALRDFINNQMKDGDLVAIVRTGAGIGALQSFTNDKRLLMAAVDRIKWNSMGRGGIGPFVPIEPTLREELDGMQKADGSTREVAGVAEEKELLRQFDEFRNDRFSIGTLGSLRYIIRGMSSLPGRKSIILFSEGFALSGEGNRVLDAMRIVADLANRASVVVYTIDPRGVIDPTMANAFDDIRRVVPDSPGAGRFDEGPREKRAADFRESQLSLNFLAAETGGLSIKNQNFFERGLLRVVEDQSSYYLLGYEPDENLFDPKKSKFNRLEVRVTRPGVKVRYRSGFFGITDQTLRNATVAPQQKIISALVSPFEVNEVNLSVYPVFDNDPKRGDLIQALVHIDANDIVFSESNGNRKANFDLIAMTFGTNGTPVDQYSRNYTIEVSERAYRNMLKNGFVYSHTVPIKKNGAYQFRIALRDTVTDKVGSASQFIEVPDVKKRLVMSNLVLDAFSQDEWAKFRAGGSRDESERSVLLDAAVRKFRRDSIIRFDYVIYNPKLSTALESQTRLIHDGKVIFEETPKPVRTSGLKDLSRIESAGGLSIGNSLEPGSYILQVVVFDRSDEKRFTAQFAEFEVVD
ncbi:MAG: VWA domain-containing protein [Acidobacteria bacterium]|nr:VWA domain-containing protein [Acidobacteriota bacterium]